MTDVGNKNTLRPAADFASWSVDGADRPSFSRAETPDGPVFTIASAGSGYYFGKWVATFYVTEYETYAFEARQKSERGRARALISWAADDGKYIIREYAVYGPSDSVEPPGDCEPSKGGGSSENFESARLFRKACAPGGSAAAVVELVFETVGPGSASWRDVSFYKAEPDAPRAVTVASAFFSPRRNFADNLKAMLALADSAGRANADILLFTENAYDRGAADSVAKRAVAVPGPETDAISKKAAELGMYIVAGLTERDGGYYYNTAALFGRDGRVAGRYRKTHLPAGEQEAGYRPGSGLPVFKTDFGVIGVLICFDLEYFEAGRALKRKGAEMILAPTIGDYAAQSLMLAKWNGVYVAVSGGDGPTPSKIIDPNGEIVADADNKKDGLAVKKIDLSAGCYGKGTGFWPARSDAKNALIYRRRDDIY